MKIQCSYFTRPEHFYKRKLPNCNHGWTTIMGNTEIQGCLTLGLQPVYINYVFVLEQVYQFIRHQSSQIIRFLCPSHLWKVWSLRPFRKKEALKRPVKNWIQIDIFEYWFKIRALYFKESSIVIESSGIMFTICSWMLRILPYNVETLQGLMIITACLSVCFLLGNKK